MLVAALGFFELIVSALELASISNQKYKIRPAIISINSNGPLFHA